MKKMKIKILSSSLFMGAMMMTSCQKQPTAAFKTDKSTYVAGETVHLTNSSIDADHYLWTFPDGTTGTAANYDYTLNVNDADGTETFKLKTFSKNGKKTNETTQSITVTAAKGDVTFWNCGTCAGTLPIVVSLNGVSSNITNAFASTPSCSASGCAVFNGLKVGTYSFTASDGSTTWSGNVTVAKNSCTTFELL